MGPEAVLSTRVYSCLQNILACYSFGSVIYFEEKAIRNCENQNNWKGM
jgi:hypothetical protein